MNLVSRLSVAGAVLVCFAASPVQAEEDQLAPGRMTFAMLAAGQVGLQGYDVYSTLTGMKAGHVENNPMLRGMAGRPGTFIAVKVGLTATTIYAAERMWRNDHKKAAIVLLAVSNGLMTAVAVRNASVLRQRR